MIFSILLVVLCSDSFLNNWYHEAAQEDIPTNLKYLFDYNKLVINVIIIIISQY